jgi:hypothetical protein
MRRLLNRLQVFVRSISKGEQAGRSQDRPGSAQVPVRMDYVRDTFEAIRAALGDEYTMGDLLLLLQKVYRKKDLLIERIPMPADQEGECRALLDTDLIRLEEDLDEAQKYMVLLHEISHLFLDHIMQAPQTLSQFMSESEVSPVLYRNNDIECDKETEVEGNLSLHHIEQEAEALATLLYVRIFMTKTLIPLSARSIHEREQI